MSIDMFSPLRFVLIYLVILLAIRAFYILVKWLKQHNEEMLFAVSLLLATIAFVITFNFILH